jgi:CPA2 family monovalent cation:H+ antiporter-2
VGQTACRILRDFEVRTVVVDLNLDTVRNLMAGDQPAVYGDATRRDILEAAGILRAKYLLITIPDVLTRSVAILAAKSLNEDLHVFARARYIQERAWLEEVGATEICIEEAEIALGLAIMLLREVGADEERIRQELKKIQRELGSHGAEAANLERGE